MTPEISFIRSKILPYVEGHLAIQWHSQVSNSRYLNLSLEYFPCHQRLDGDSQLESTLQGDRFPWKTKAKAFKLVYKHKGTPTNVF